MLKLSWYTFWLIKKHILVIYDLGKMLLGIYFSWEMFLITEWIYGKGLDIRIYMNVQSWWFYKRNKKDKNQLEVRKYYLFFKTFCFSNMNLNMKFLSELILFVTKNQWLLRLAKELCLLVLLDKSTFKFK